MGLLCPVCETPQADAGHLANHLAITAMVGQSDHRAWLDTNTPGWEEEGQAELAPRVADQAPAAEFPQVFEDTVGGVEGATENEPRAQRGGALFDETETSDLLTELSSSAEREPAGPADETTRAVLRKARELTRQRRQPAAPDDGSEELDPVADEESTEQP